MVGWRNKTSSTVLDRVKYDILPIKARTERGEIIMHYKKHGVFVLVVLMLHQHKTQKKKKNRITASASVYNKQPSKTPVTQDDEVI